MVEPRPATRPRCAQGVELSQMRDASLDEEFARLRVASPDRRQTERNAPPPGSAAAPGGAVATVRNDFTPPTHWRARRLPSSRQAGSKSVLTPESAWRRRRWSRAGDAGSGAGCRRRCCLRERKNLQMPSSAFGPEKTSGRFGRSFRLRGLPGTSGVLRGFAEKSRAGCARDEKKPAVVCAVAGNKRGRFAGTLAGATGLEPATSGVTGRRSNQLNYAPGRATV